MSGREGRQDPLPVGPDAVPPGSLDVDLTGCVDAMLAASLGRRRRLTVALSGGVDSVCLLHAVAALAPLRGWLVDVLHVHHGLHPLADAWQAHCAACCQRLGLPFRALAIEPRLLPGQGLEASLRQHRYAAFRTHATEVLLTAHHGDDQAETVLMRLLRGAGPAGLAGIPAMRSLGPHTLLLRPLLPLRRQHILAWAGARRLSWVEDPGNRNPEQARNLLRGQILPRLEQHWPGLVRRLAGSARRMGETAQLLEALAAIDLSGHLDAPWLPVPVLLALPPSRARNALACWLRRQTLHLDEPALAAVLCQLDHPGGSAPVLCRGGRCLLRYRDALAVVPDQPSPPLGWRRAWQGEGLVRLPWGGQLRFEPAMGRGIACRLEGGGWHIAAAGTGEQLRTGRLRAVRKLHQEAALPPWWRQRAPRLWRDGGLVWVAGGGLDLRYRVGEGERGLVPVWLPGTQALGRIG